MNSRVLILGNGISRLDFTDKILEYPGEVWACNYAFKDFPDKITRLTGHTEPLLEAQEWKETHGLKYDIYSGSVAKKRPDWKTFVCGGAWSRDSGSTLVAEALTIGCDVDLCGFDMGGPDVYCYDHYKLNKNSWVRRWGEIINKWGADRLNFWGYDHKPYLILVSQKRATFDKYSKMYLRGRPHLVSEEYRERFEREVMLLKKPSNVEKVKVQYGNGYQTWVNRQIATILINRGQVVEVETVEPEKEKK